jgi:hypothetical protein
MACSEPEPGLRAFRNQEAGLYPSSIMVDCVASCAFVHGSCGHVLQKMQGHSTLVANLDSLLDELCRELGGQLDVKGPLEPIALADYKAEGAAICNYYAASVTSINNFIIDMGIFAQETLGKLFEEDAAEVAELQHANGEMYIDGIEGIEVVQAE